MGWSRARTKELWELISTPQTTAPQDTPQDAHTHTPETPPPPRETPAHPPHETAHAHTPSLSALGPDDPWPPWLSECGLGDCEATLLSLGVETAEDLLIVEASDLEEEGMGAEEAQRVWTRIQAVIAALLEDDDE